MSFWRINLKPASQGVPVMYTGFMFKDSAPGATPSVIPAQGPLECVVPLSDTQLRHIVAYILSSSKGVDTSSIETAIDAIL